MILRVQKSDLQKCLEVIRPSFGTVAEELGFTEESCPSHTAFMPLERLERDFDFGNPMYAYVKDGRFIGFVALRPKDDGICEMKQLCVLPEYRHLGIGRELVAHTKRIAWEEFHRGKMTIGIIDEGAVLKAWYAGLGFIQTGTQRFEHLPFTVGFMEMPLP